MTETSKAVTSSLASLATDVDNVRNNMEHIGEVIASNTSSLLEVVDNLEKQVQALRKNIDATGEYYQRVITILCTGEVPLETISEAGDTKTGSFSHVGLPT